MNETHLIAGLPPVADSRTTVLILGSFPSERSLASREYYANPRNQFWKIMSAVSGVFLEQPYEARIEALLRRGIGLWDVIRSCRRDGSLDSAIEVPVFNEFTAIFQRCPNLQAMAFNGKKAESAPLECYPPRRFTLPSSSSAYGMYLAEKIALWGRLLLPHLSDDQQPSVALQRR